MTQPVTLLSSDAAPCNASAEEPGGPGVLDTAKGPLPLRAMTVVARIDGLVARTEVEQTFVNNLGETIEATYIFPLPDRAAVTAFRLRVAGRGVDGILKERGEARMEYDLALAAGHRAAIAEEERPDVFTLRVGNLPAGEEARVTLTLVGPLEVDLGEATYRFPLVVAPRYIPGTPLDGEPVGDGTQPDTDAVPDASRITPPVLLPGYPHPVRLGIEVELNAGALAARELRTSLPAVSEPIDGDALRVRVVPGQRLDRDFILRFQVGEDAVTTSLLVEEDAGGAGKGTFQLTIVPPRAASGRRAPRSIAFVLDRSGSMEGWKIVAARRAVARMVETLVEGDRFVVLAFDNEIDTPSGREGSGLVPATSDRRSAAVDFLTHLDARGGTEMAQPLCLVAWSLAAEDARRDRALVLVTDGQVGNEDQLLQALAGKLQGIRVFTLGIDSAVNAGFLRRLAVEGRGACELVDSEARLEDVMEKLHRLLETPVLTDLRLDPAGLEIEADSVAPSRLPALFAGVPVTIAGRWSGGRGSLRLRAKDADGREWSETPRVVSARSGALAAIWARGRVRDVEDEYAKGGGGHEALEQQIVAVSTRHGVLSRFTAYVAVDRASRVELSGQRHGVVQPVELLAGWVDNLAMRMAAPSGACLRVDHFSQLEEQLEEVEVLRCSASWPISHGALQAEERQGPSKPSKPSKPMKPLAALLEEALGLARRALRRICLRRRGSLERLARLLAEIEVRKLVPANEGRRRLEELRQRLLAALRQGRATAARFKPLLLELKALLEELRQCYCQPGAGKRPRRARN
jgi:Ca-activated chloride channel family protein